jgi:hypothetical protein
VRRCTADVSLRTELSDEEIRTSGNGTRDSANNGNNGNRTSQPTPLADSKPTPDTELLVVYERVLQAFAAYIAAHADLLAGARGGAHLGEERLRIGLRTQSLSNPRLIIERECRDAAMRTRQGDERGYLK